MVEPLIHPASILAAPTSYTKIARLHSTRPAIDPITWHASISPQPPQRHPDLAGRNHHFPLPTLKGEPTHPSPCRRSGSGNRYNDIFHTIINEKRISRVSSDEKRHHWSKMADAYEREQYDKSTHTPLTIPLQRNWGAFGMIFWYILIDKTMRSLTPSRRRSPRWSPLRLISMIMRGIRIRWIIRFVDSFFLLFIYQFLCGSYVWEELCLHCVRGHGKLTVAW